MQIGDFLNLLKKPKRQADGSFLALCPAHADSKTLSLHITQKDGTILLKCFAGCTAEAVCSALGLETADLFNNTDNKPAAKRIVATYTYEDEQGHELYQVIRYDPKSFSQRHKNGGGDYVWNMDGVTRVLYHLPDILKSDKVILVEGEKDADNLRALGLVATTSPGGAGAWKPEYANPLKGKRVTIIPDKDRAGYGYAKAVVDSLKGQAELKTIILPGDTKDISDWLQSGRQMDELMEEDIAALDSDPMTFENKGSRYLFKWGTFTAEVSKLKTIRDNTTCQMVIYPATGKSYRVKLNLESRRTVTEIEKELRVRFKNEGWKEILDDIVSRTLEEFEKGEPVVLIHSTDEIQQLEYLVGPIIPLGKPTVFFGDPGAGKSQMAAVIGILTFFSDWDDNPLRLVPPKRTMRGLVLDWEADEDDWRRQIKWFTDVFGLGYVQLSYRRCSLSLAHDIEAIKAHIESVNADYVLIDSVSLAAGGDLNHMDVATNYFRALRQLNMTTISLAHTSKDRESKNKTILGSVLFEAGARNVWEVRGQEDDNALDIGLFHRKSNLSKKHAPLGYRISYQPDPADPSQTIPDSMVWHDPKSVEEFVERMNNTQRVLHILKEGLLTTEQVSFSLELSAPVCRVTLNRLKDKKLVEKIGDKWGLVTPSF